MFRQRDPDGEDAGYNVFTAIDRFELPGMEEMNSADRGNQKGPISIRRVVQSGLILAIGTVAAATCASTADGGAKRGEIGIGTDDQLAGALERFRMTKVTGLVG